MNPLYCNELNTCLGETKTTLCKADFACFSILKEDYNVPCIVKGCFNKKDVEFNCKNKTNEEFFFNEKVKVLCCNNENFCNIIDVDSNDLVFIISICFIFLFIFSISLRVFFLLKRKKKLKDKENNFDDIQFNGQSFFKEIKLSDLIGKGRYGEVWKGMYYDQPVAVKKFFEADLESWKRESNIYKLHTLSRDTVLKCKGWEVVSVNLRTEYWLVLDYHSLGSLYDFLENKILNRHQVLSIIRSITNGIVHLHDNYQHTISKPGIAHRDLKSKNLMMKNNQTVCIADFGLSITSDEILANEKIKVYVGTKRYMAPEILNNTLNVKNFESFELADIYSTSLVFWELINQSEFNDNLGCYYSPYHEYTQKDPSVNEMKQVVCIDNLRPKFPTEKKVLDQFSEFNLNILEKICNMIAFCWEKDVNKRPKALYIQNYLEKLNFE